MKNFFEKNDGLHRTLRTIVQLVIAYLCTEGTELLANIEWGKWESVALGAYTLILVPIFKLIAEKLTVDIVEVHTDEDL